MTEVSLDEFQRRFEIITEVTARTFDRAAQYDTAVVGLGFIGFFALWAGVAHDIPRWAALASAGLVGISLFSYIGWQIIQMIGRQIGEAPLQSIIADGDIFLADDFSDRWNEAARQSQRISARIMKIWKPVFGTSVVTGFIGGALLSVVSLAMAVEDLWPAQGLGHSAAQIRHAAAPQVKSSKQQH